MKSSFPRVSLCRGRIPARSLLLSYCPAGLSVPARGGSMDERTGIQQTTLSRRRWDRRDEAGVDGTGVIALGADELAC